MAAPIRIGVLSDTSESLPSEGQEAGILRFARLPVDDLVASGRIDRAVEYVHASGLGLPSGTAWAVERAFDELANRGVLAILGPAIGDNALVATPLADRYKIPTINWAGTERGRSHYMFHLQVGSHEDESVVIARLLAERGIYNAGVVYDRSPIGRRYLQFLLAECDVLDIRIQTAVPIAPLAEDATREVQAVRETGVEGLVYLGLGLAARPVALAVSRVGWKVERVMNTAGMRGAQPEFGRDIDGWHYIDMHADENRTLVDLRKRLGLDASSGAGPAFGYDVGQLLAEGLARAPELTRDGIVEGLENVKWLPAAEGHEGTLLGFGHFDRGALHGRYLVLRQWRDGVSNQV